MNKTNLQKNFSYALIHLVELIVVILVSFGIFKYAPQNYQIPSFALFIVLYLFYLANSLFEDYKSYKGGDFTV